jgi:hypothetical protein
MIATLLRRRDRTALRPTICGCGRTAGVASSFAIETKKSRLSMHHEVRLMARASGV